MSTVVADAARRAQDPVPDPAPARDAPSPSPSPSPAAAQRLTLLTLNLHKGFSAMGTRDVLHEIRDAVRLVNADLVFLQEVVGEGAGTSAREFERQYEFLADSIWGDHAYGRNAVSEAGHHGNALLSRYPITQWHNHNITVHRREPRGLLQCAIALPNRTAPLHAFCVHLGLLERERRLQLEALAGLMQPLVARGDAVVAAGDFNDWTHRGHAHLTALTHTGAGAGAGVGMGAGVHDVHAHTLGRLPRTFPARWPLLALDRIYVSPALHDRPLPLPSRPWSHLSDHAPLAAEIVL